LLFLKKSDYHGVQVGREAVADVRDFMKSHRQVLDKTERDHGVPASVISSLLWLESRYGQNQGYFHVPSVYLHLLQVERPEVIKHLHNQAGNYTNKLNQKTFKEITKRTHKKAKWALEELRALQKMHGRDKNLVRTLRGSFAGAFGWSQFIPSSYVKWARGYKKGSVANLSTSSDAVYSVGFYLRDHGWKKKARKSHVKALLGYNNSLDYANAILNLAQQVDALQFRKPSDIAAE
jgi:membrane-bound lytic murein transglycosylase B